LQYTEDTTSTGTLNPWLPRNMLLVTVCCIAHTDIWNERKPLSPFPGEVKLEHSKQFWNLWTVYLWTHTLHH